MSAQRTFIPENSLNVDNLRPKVPGRHEIGKNPHASYTDRLRNGAEHSAIRQKIGSLVSSIFGEKYVESGIGQRLPPELSAGGEYQLPSVAEVDEGLDKYPEAHAQQIKDEFERQENTDQQ